MKMKKWIAALLVLVVSGMLFTACGGDTDTTSGGNNTDTQTEAAGGNDNSSGDQDNTTPAGGGSDQKVAMILTGPINDAGWNESAYKGLIAAESTHGVEVAYSENVPQPDFESTIYDYANKGYDIIICHGMEFTDAVVSVSPQFPDSMFCVVNGDSTMEPNMASFRFNTPQTGFLSGAVAGLITETNSVAMFGGTRMPHIEDALIGFEAGAKYVNPDAEVNTGFIESMTDVAKGKEMAITYIEQGADVVCGNANQAGLGVIDGAKSKDVYAIGYIDDQYDVAPETVFVSSIQSVQFMVATIIDWGLKGEIQPELYLMGAADGAIYLSDFHGHDAELPEGGLELINEIFDGLVDGSLAEQGIVPKSVFEQ